MAMGPMARQAGTRIDNRFMLVSEVVVPSSSRIRNHEDLSLRVEEEQIHFLISIASRCPFFSKLC